MGPYLELVLGFLVRLYRFLYPPIPPRPLLEEKPKRKLKFGILGATNIAPLAVIRACLTHPEVEVYAMAARDPQRAREYAKHWWNIPKVHASYQDLIDDPEVDLIYNGLPSGLHYEWTMKALDKGKHVLVEKPSACHPDDTRAMFEYAESKGLVLLEAIHYRFHPAIQRVKDILDSQELGNIKKVTAKLTVFAHAFAASDIRYNYGLGGGAFLELGCYTLNIIRYLTSSDPLRVTTAECIPHAPPNAPKDFKPDVDRAITATIEMPGGVEGVMITDLAVPHPENSFIPLVRAWMRIECERGTVYEVPFNYPSIYHKIEVTRVGEDGEKAVRTEQAYVFPKDSPARVKGEDWWTTYRYQMEAFVDKIKGREPQTWIPKEDSIANMEWIARVYDKSGVGSRPKSKYSHPFSPR